jgi:RNA 2',3'-cyclic 3'-phosphodiesterase
MNMPRLFIAIDLPDAAKQQLGELCSGIDGAKWVKREQMHLTLRFIGDVDDASLAGIQNVLEKITAPSFEMHLEAVGQFPAKGKPRVTWAGVKAPAELSGLQTHISTALNTLGLPPEDYPFSPHITLARLKTPPSSESVRQFFARNAAFKTGAFPVSEYILFSSVLSAQGSRYQQEGIFSLKV